MSNFLSWYQLIFLAPLGVAAILLVFTLLQGMDSDGDADDIDADADMDGDADDVGDGESDDAETHPQHAGFSLWRLIGIGRAPLMFALEVLFVFWGLFGYFANLLLLKTTAPTLTEMIPSLAIALVGGILGARGASELYAKLLPDTETRVISRDALIGLKGRITFEATATAGRIRIYDDHGTIHEHECRPSPGHEAIPKGRSAIVVDRDHSTNRLIVEELSG